MRSGCLNLLKAAGFENIKTNYPFQHFDQRDSSKLHAMLDYWLRLLLSGADVLLSEGRVSETLIEDMKREIADIRRSEDGVFFYCPIQVFASHL